jgi:cell wall-associated NlpC family hydrolase
VRRQRRLVLWTVVAAVACARAAGPAGAVPAPPSPSARVAAGYAHAALGAPYRWGGLSLGTGCDSSGLVAWSFARAGLPVPHSTQALYRRGVPVPRSALQPGDLVFFAGRGHVGIYVGQGAFIHAPHTGDVVRVASSPTRSTGRSTTAPSASSGRSARASRTREARQLIPCPNVA